MSAFKTVGKLMTTADWKYQISLALPENTPDQVLSDIYDIVESLLTRDGPGADTAPLGDYVTLLERNNGRLREVLKEALEQTGCDGDLCNYRWHEKARVLLGEDDVRV